MLFNKTDRFKKRRAGINRCGQVKCIAAWSLGALAAQAGLLFVISSPAAQTSPFNWSAEFEPIGNPLRLTTAYRLYDYTAGSWRTDVRHDIGSLKDGQIAYFAFTNDVCSTAAPVSACYRYFNSGSSVLKDEVTDPGSGWTPQLYLGELFDSSSLGMSEVQLNQNSSGKFITQMEGETVKSGYSYDKTIGYAYPRFGNAGTDFFTLSRGGVDWKFNQVAGGSLWHVVYDGVQFVNNHDLGRQIQCGAQWTLVNENGDSNRFTCAESGMGCSAYDFSDPLTRMGSPMQYCQTNALGILLTKTFPLENIYENTTHHYGGSALEPVLYQDLYFRKEISAGVRGRDQVLRWKQVFRVTDSFTNLVWNHTGVAAACLKANVTNLWVYNASDGTLTDKTEWWWNDGKSKQFAEYNVTGKCIIMGTDANHCFGMMAKDTADGGSVDYWMGYSWKTLGPIDETGEFDANTVTMIGHNRQPWSRGENTSIAYLIVGSLSSVTNDAQTLYDDQSLIPW